MPYGKNEELPKSVRDILPDAAQSLFRAVFNSQHARELSEERSFASAWGAVKNAGYEKDEKTGKWVKVDKHGDHDQSEHGNWAHGSGSGDNHNSRDPKAGPEPMRRGSKAGISGSASKFTAFLEETLIPDLKESGSEGYVDDFSTAVRLIRGDGTKSEAKSFVGYLRNTIGPDTKESGREFTAKDLFTAANHIERTWGLKKSAAASFTAEIQKLDEDQNLVFGFASIIEDEAGNLIVDSQGDVITPDELEKAAYDFMEASRKAGEMHKNSNAGVIVESMVLTKAKRKVMKLEDGPTGWWIGMRVLPEVFAKVKAGDYKAFSIGGKGERKEFEAEVA